MDTYYRVCQRAGCENQLGKNPKQKYCCASCRFWAWEERKVLELLRQRRHEKEKVNA